MNTLLVAVFVLFVLMCNDTQCLIVLFPGVFALVKNYVGEGIPGTGRLWRISPENWK